MNHRLLGFRELDFKSDRGEAIKGTQLFVGFDENGVTGQAVDKLFVRDGLDLPELTPGMVLDVQYNRKGRVVAVKAVGPR